MIADDFVFNTGETQEDLRKKYNPQGSDLRKAQLRMLDMLKYLDSVCKKLQIPYSLDGGNILGAVRHGGFIPWDDDVDIIIERKHLKKLNDYLEKNHHHQYVIQNHHTDKGYMGCWIVLRDLKSEYIQDNIIHNIRQYRGLQIDIFAMETGMNKQIHLFGNLLHRSLVEKNINKNNIRIANFFYAICNKFVFPVMRFFCDIFGNKNKLMYPIGTSWNWRYDRKSIFPVSHIEFEGLKFSSVNNPNEYLKEHFGDYMKLPSPDIRDKHKANYRVWD